MAVPPTKKTQKGSELRHIIAVMRRWTWFLVLCPVLAAGCTFVLTKRQPPVYRATNLLLVDTKTPGQDSYSDLLASNQLVTTYVSLISQPVVLQQAASSVGGVTASALAERIHISPLAGAPVIQVQVDDANPTRSAALSNAVANAFIAVQQQAAQDEFNRAQQQLNEQQQQTAAQIRDLNSQITALRGVDPSNPELPALQQQLAAAVAHRSTQQDANAQLVAQYLSNGVPVRVFQRAEPPDSPAAPTPFTAALEAAALGLAVALGIVILGELLQRRVRSADDLEELCQLDTLATVAFAPAHKRRRRLAGHAPPLSSDIDVNAKDNSAARESFRALRTRLAFAGRLRPFRIIVVAEATGRSAATTTAINLAISLAEAGSRTLLIDGDLREPAAYSRVTPSTPLGLSQWLVASGEGEDLAVSHISATHVPGLYLLPSGPPLPHSTELLASQRMQGLLEGLVTSGVARGGFDVVVIDSPPAATSVDATVLAAYADAVILAVDASRARADDILAAKEALARVDAPILGAVVIRGMAKGVSVRTRTGRRSQAGVSRDVTGEERRDGYAALVKERAGASAR